MIRHQAALWLGLALVACGGEPGAVGSSESDIVDGERADRYPYAVLVDAQLDIGVGECSGALVAPQVVLTAGHCIHGFGPWEIIAPYADGGMQKVRASDGEVMDWDTPPDDPRPEMHDVGLLYLDAPITLSRYPTIDDRDAVGDKVRYVGRVLDGESSSSELYVGKSLPTRDGREVGWPLTITTTKYAEHGDSGGPTVRSSDRYRIVGVDSGGNWDLDIQLSARVDLAHDWLD